MVYVKRDSSGNIVGVSELADEHFAESVASEDPALQLFLARVGRDASELEVSDQDFIRVLEDVVELLISKGVILFTELPQTAQDKIMNRQLLRSRLGEALDLLED